MVTRTTVTTALVLLCACGAQLQAQASRDDPVDVQARFGTALNFDLPKKWVSAIEYELRMVDNASAYRGSYLTAELGYGLAKRLSVFTSYRLARITDATAHRYAVGAQVEQKMGKRTTVSFRPTLQYQAQRVDDDGQSIDETTFLRTRVRAKLQARKHLSFYGSVEPFFVDSEFPIDNWRNAVGVQYELTKTRKIDFHYIYRADYAKIYNRTFHVFGAEFSLDVKLPR